MRRNGATGDMGDIDFGAFDALTFDCYGTLIDWETGILAALEPHTARATTTRCSSCSPHHEAALEAGPYLCYKAVLAGACAARHRSELRADRRGAGAFGVSVKDWPAFADSAAALVSSSSASSSA